MHGEHNLTAMQREEEARTEFETDEEWERSGLPEDFTIEAPDEELELRPERKPAKSETEKRKVA